MVPLYLKYIPINQYSLWLATGNILAWLSATDPGLTIVLQQQVADAYGKKDFTKVKRLIGGGLLFCFLVLVLVSFFGYFASQNLPELLNITSLQDRDVLLAAFTLAFVGTALMIFSFGISAINSGLQGSIMVGLINISVTAASILLTYGLLKSEFGLMSLAISIVFSGVCFSIFQGLYLLLRVYKEKIGVSFSFTGMKKLAKLLSYTFISRTIGTIANNIDLLVVSRILGPESVVILALTRKSTELSRELINQPAVAFQPAVSHLKGEGDIKKLSLILVRLIHILTWVLFLVVGGLLAFNESFVNLWVGEDFFAGEKINLIICISVIFIMINNCLSQLCFALGDVKGTSIILAIHAVIFIPIVILGTNYFGILGTVLSPILSFLFISIWYFPRKFATILKLSTQDIKNIINQLFLCILIIIFLSYTFSFFDYGTWFKFFVFVSFYVIAYALLLFLLSKSFSREVRLFFDYFPTFKR